MSQPLSPSPAEVSKLRLPLGRSEHLQALTLSLLALRSSRLRPGADIIPSRTTLGSGMGMTEADGAAQLVFGCLSQLTPTCIFPGLGLAQSLHWSRPWWEVS